MIATSLDGLWAAVRRGRELTLFASGSGPAVGRIELASEDVDLAFVGPPAMLAVISREGAPAVTLYQPPDLEVAACLDLAAPLALAAATGQRLGLVSADGKQAVVVRGVGRSLSSQVVELGAPAEFAVGLERNQILFGLGRKLEVWDAVSGRPLLRLQLQLPPAPRIIGAALGHLWAARPGSEEVFVYRLSDGRPFRHYVGAPIEQVVCHPASPLIVVVTPRGLVRLHCLAHSVATLETPWTVALRPSLGLIVQGEDVTLAGLGAGEREPWLVAIAGAATRESSHHLGEAAAAAPASTATRTDATAPATKSPLARADHRWREPLAAFGAALADGGEPELPMIAIESELGMLATRLGLTAAARRAMIALYSVYLVGEPGLSIAAARKVLGDWTEPLGQGGLAALAMLDRRAGKVRLRGSVTDALDGADPRAIRIVGEAAISSPAGACRISREARTDEQIEAALVGQLGRIGVVDGSPAVGVLEARLHGATAVALVPPPAPVHRWPRGAGLVIVVDDRVPVPAWVTALPPLG